MIVTMKCVLLFLVLAIGLVVSAGPCDGDLWPDDKGVHINAHGGGVMWHEGRVDTIGTESIRLLVTREMPHME